MFITTNVHYRIPVFEEPPCAREAIDTLYRVQQLHPFSLYGFCIMPDHCHFLIKVPAPESISRIMRMFKQGTSLNIGRGPFWQSRFHMKYPRNGHATLRYIHFNPVKAGLVKKPEQYPFSSACGKWDVSSLEC